MSETPQRALGSYDIKDGVASATLLGLMYDVRVKQSGELEISETKAVMPNGEPAPSWSYALGTPNIQFEQDGAPLELAHSADLKLKGNTLIRSWGNARELYEHHHHSLKHSLIVSQRPQGKGDLLVSFPLLSSARHERGPDGSILVLDGSGQLRMKWSELVITDADGKRIEARFEVQQDALTMRVQAERARFPLLIDPLATNPAANIDGDQISANLGAAIANAGDVNGDGFSDLLVGQPNYTQNGVKSGRALLFLGSASGIQNTASWSLVSGGADDRVGDSLVGLGDVDGDGFSDIVVSAPFAESSGGPSNEGLVWVYRGTNQIGITGLLNMALVWTRAGGVAERRMGQRVERAGDTNCDGKPDLIISAYDLNNTASTGIVEVHKGKGGAPFFFTDVWSQIGESNGFGSATSTAGNINGVSNGGVKCDGIIVGDFSFDNGGPASNNFGKTYIYTGSTTGLRDDAAFTKQGTLVGERLGRAVAGGRDLNNDGLADVLVSSQLADNSGKVEAFPGKTSSNPFATTIWSVSGGAPSTFFGLALAQLRDVNQDGRADVAIGANNADGGRGQASIYLNSAGGLPATPSWTFSGTDVKDRVGTSIISAGDVNKDGAGDFVIAAASSSVGTNTSSGRVFVFHGVAGCQIGGMPFESGTANPANPCEVCDPLASQNSWSPASNGTSCSDGSLCTTNDVCTAGVCGGAQVACPMSTDSCRPNVCNQTTGKCGVQYLPAGALCDERDDKPCTYGVCDGRSSCRIKVSSGCFVNGECIAEGAADPNDQCRVCSPQTNPLRYSSAPSTTVCNDLNPCTTNDRCSNGGICIGKTKLPDGTSCDDQNACTINETCSTGVCTNGANICP
jgi:hypothetical protein